jgi:uncharacterized protein (TIGR02145 family)
MRMRMRMRMRMNIRRKFTQTAWAMACIAALGMVWMHGCIIDPELADAIKDIDGNQYGTREIGLQTWMTSDLRTTRYIDGTPIPLVEDSVKWVSATKPAFCWYGNDKANAGNNGALYNFYVFDTTANGGKQLCPLGWHVPTLAEWNQLIEFAGGIHEAGLTLKDRYYNDWVLVSEKPNNPHGFSAFPGGFRSGGGTFSNLGTWACFWTSTRNSGTGAYGVVIADKSSTITINDKLSKKIGSSVRCIKD